MNTNKPLADNPNTLKRQPTGSWKPVSAIGAARQTIGVDKMASKVDIIMDKVAKVLSTESKEEKNETKKQEKQEKKAAMEKHGKDCPCSTCKQKYGFSKKGSYIKLAGVLPPGTWTKLRVVGDKAKAISEITSSGAKVFEHEGNVYYQHAKNLFEHMNPSDVFSNKKRLSGGGWSKHAKHMP